MFRVLDAISAKLERSIWTRPTLKAAPAASVSAPLIAAAALRRDAPRFDSCFNLCFSHTCLRDLCSGVPQIMNMEGWVLLGADRQEVPVTLYPGQDLVEADLSDIPDVYQDLYWHAPKTYLGDKVRGAVT